MILSAVLMTDSTFLISLLFVHPNQTNIGSHNALNYCTIKINHDIDVNIV